MYLKKIQRLLQAIVFLAALSPSRAAVNLALVPTPDMPTEPVFLLTAAFSKLAGVNLLERAELDRILRERALSATSATDILQAARLLGADAVMFLEASGATKQIISARLAVVSKGAIIHANRAPWSSAWTATMLREFGPLIPKTVLPPDRAIKLSVLNLRSPGNSAASEALDRELTSLLLLRLSREPEVLVLERRKLADLVFEKDLEQSSEQFWTGSHLIDGTVNPNGVQPNVVDLSVRLQTPGSPAQQITVQGARTNLIRIIDQLAIELLRKLNATAGSQWNPASEAAQHLQEAEWALRWRMYEEAQAAADSAWALGLQSPQSATARSLAYARAALHPDRIWIQHMEPGLFESSATVEPAPEPAALQMLRVALAITESALAQHQSWLTNQQWNSSVNETLKAAGETLDCYYWFPKGRGNEHLPEVRQYARSILNTAMNHPENHRRFWFENDPQNTTELDAFYEVPNVFQSATTYGGIFNETPEEALSAYRQLITGSGFPYVRKFLFGRHSQDPRLAAWRPADQGRLKGLWTGFVDEMLASTNAMLRIEGKYLSLELLPDLPALQKGLLAFLGMTLTNTSGLGLYRIPPRFGESAHNVSESRLWLNDKVGSGEVALINDYQESFNMLDGRYTFLKAQTLRATVERKFKEHIASGRPYDSALFSAHLLGISNREKARVATNDLTNYLAAITNTPNALDAKAAAEVAERLAALEKVIARPTHEEKMKELFEAIQRADIARARTNQTVRRPPAADTNIFALRLSSDDFWQFPPDEFPIPPFSSFFDPDTHAPIYRDGKLWFLARENFLRTNKAVVFGGSLHRPIILNVDVSTMRTNIYSPPTETDDYYDDDIVTMVKGTRRYFTFEAIHPYLFIADQAQLRRLDTRTRQWTHFALPVAGGVLHRVRDRLLLSAESGIFELLDNGEKTRVLASVRRRPAVTALDSLETFGKPPPILPGPAGSLRALLNGNAYRFEGGDWKAETHFTNLATTVQGEHILFHGGEFTELYLLAPTNTSPLFIGTGFFRGPKGVSYSPNRSQALFDLPELSSGEGVNMVLDGYATILELGAMTVFDPAQPHPLALPVAFETRLPRNPGSAGFFRLSRLWMAQSEAGFLLGLPGYNGFWKISRADLDRAFAQARRAAARLPHNQSASK